MVDTYWGLFGGYSFIWLVVWGYVYSVHLRLSKIEHDIAKVEDLRE